MSKKIVDVINITSAHGWFVSSDNGDNFDPVACWALVTIFDHRYESLPPDRAIIGVKSDELDDLLGIDPSDRMYMHSSEVDSLREKVIVSTGVEEY